MTDEQAIFLGDLLPCALSAVDWGGVGTGDTVAVFGCGPVGLMAQKIAWLRGAERVIGVDVLPYRLEAARRSSRAETFNAAEEDPIVGIRALTAGRGADVCIDTIGLSLDRGRGVATESGISSLQIAFAALRPGGRLSGVGTYDGSSQLSIAQLFSKAVSLRLGPAPTHELIDGLFALIRSGSVVSDDIITHRLFLSDAERGYRLASEKRESCIKVVLRPDASPQ
jgi:alcohol dehydrogenase